MSSQLPQPVDVLMVAIGGYGYYYLQTLLEQVPPHSARLAGIVDPEAWQSRAWNQVRRLAVPVCPTMEAFYGAGGRADLAVVVSPIQWHVPQSIIALQHGSHVLCDKPLGGSLQEAAALIATRDAARRWVMIGYQWSFSTAIQELKRDILAGAFGRPRRFSTLCCWPRDFAYYRRNTWAGRMRDPETGGWVRDSPANNAMAHFLHNLLYLAGERADRAAHPVAVEGTLQRAYPIEAADTVACRVATREGVEILFYSSHVTSTPIEPCFRLEFEDGVVHFDSRAKQIAGSDAAGRRREYGAPDDTPQFRKLFEAIAAARHPEPAILCGPEAAAAQTAVVEMLHGTAPVAPFPAPTIAGGEADGRLHVPGLAETLESCYDRGLLPRELDAARSTGGEVR